MNCVWIFLQNLQISEIVIFLEPGKSIAVLKFLVKSFKFTRWNVGKEKNLENKIKIITYTKSLQRIFFSNQNKCQAEFLKNSLWKSRMFSKYVSKQFYPQGSGKLNIIPFWGRIIVYNKNLIASVFNSRWLFSNISSVVEFQRWWVLKSKGNFDTNYFEPLMIFSS